MGRIDVLTIWPHGIQYRDQILNMIDDEPGFTVQAIYRKHVADMQCLIDDIYASDTYPIEHLRSKSRYLLSVPGSTVAVVIIYNDAPDEQMVGDGAWRHTQDMKFVALKNKIRSAYNPSGAPESHVVHGTDFEEQARHHLKLFGLVAEPKAWTSPTLHIGESVYKCSPFLPRYFYHCNEYMVYLDGLSAHIPGLGIVPIINTPHYAFCEGDHVKYTAYWNEHWGVELCEHHSPSRYRGLLNRPELWHASPLYIKEEGEAWCIIDGLHRAAAAYHTGAREMRAVIPS